MKKNLLQRRGSNTSLTLNITGGNSSGTNIGANTMHTQHHHHHHHSTLNRFNSHNSLNVMSTPFDVQRNTNLSTAKKGLLERRNSNASLTLQLERSNIQKRALSTSNCYLRGSDLSLSSGNLEEQQTCSMCGGGGILKKNIKRSTVTTSSAQCNVIKDEFDHITQNDALIESITEKQSQSMHEYEEINTNRSNRSTRRKFLSSENLNLHNTFSLCQPPIKTSSVVDLNQSNSEIDDVYDDQVTSYCPCSNTIRRNITTKPLSPQTTSEDFKIYLANIQILQNASNILSENKLNALGNVFNRSYKRSNNDVDTSETCQSCEACVICKTCKICQTKCRCEQNCLLTNLHQEFWDLPTNYQEKPLVFGSQVKNRYKTILPNEHSRVILDGEIDSPNAVNSSREQSTFELYINANYIKVSVLSSKCSFTLISGESTFIKSNNHFKYYFTGS